MRSVGFRDGRIGRGLDNKRCCGNSGWRGHSDGRFRHLSNLRFFSDAVARLARSLANVYITGEIHLAVFAWEAESRYVRISDESRRTVTDLVRPAPKMHQFWFPLLTSRYVVNK